MNLKESKERYIGVWMEDGKGEDVVITISKIKEIPFKLSSIDNFIGFFLILCLGNLQISLGSSVRG